jgi:YfiH family protein
VEHGFRIEERNGIVLASCEALLVIPGIAHAFSTRSFDAGNAGDASARERRRRFLSVAGFGAAEPAILHQVHGGRVVRASECAVPPEADAVEWVRGDPGRLVPTVRTADCVPVLLADARGHASSAVHAGWRGVVAGIVPAAVASLAARGIAPSGVVAAIGPAIGPCCYEVGRDVADRAVAAAEGARGIASPEAGKVLLDLPGAVRAQLVRAGIPPDSVHAAPWCTRCRADLFFSYRRDGAGAGRMMASVGPAS